MYICTYTFQSSGFVSQAIVANFSRHHARTSEESKISFLKYISRWPTFGSAFFEVVVSRYIITCMYVCMYYIKHHFSKIQNRGIQKYC